jgi:hypothetical protein
MSTEKSEHDIFVENTWRNLLTEGESDKDKRFRRIFRMFRCKNKM